LSTVTTERQEVRAVAKWVRISPRKARLVVDHIRGRTVPEARTVLAFTTRAAAHEVEKVLRSAVANAEANHGLVGDDLVVSSAYVDDGLIIKRWKPRARGRVARIKKRTCHITIKVSPVDGVVPAPKAPPPPRPVAEEEQVARAEEKPARAEEKPARAEEKPARAEEPVGKQPVGETGPTEEVPEEDRKAPSAVEESPEPEREQPKRRTRLRKPRSEPKAEKKKTPKKRTLRKKKDEDQ
jgi:large subunit ribosomal protein L22